MSTRCFNPDLQIGTDGYIIRPLVEAIYTSEEGGQEFFKETLKAKKSDSPHVLEFLADSLDNLNVRDDISATDTSNDSKDANAATADDEEAFYNFLSTGRYEPKVSVDEDDADADFDATSGEAEKDMFYDFLATGRTKKEQLKAGKREKTFPFPEFSSNHLDFEAGSKDGRFKRHVSSGDVGVGNDVGRIDDYFAAKDSLFGGSGWDGHYIGDIWFVVQLHPFRTQGGQIGRFFAFGVIGQFGQVFCKLQNYTEFWGYFSTVNVISNLADVRR
jgi:hypothetical protein